MTVAELIAIVRQRIDDVSTPYLVSDAQLVQFANTAQREACERGLLLYSSFSVATTAGYASYTLTEPEILAILWARFEGRSLAAVQASDVDHLDLAAFTRTGTPQYYAQIGGALRLYPTPEVDATVTFGGYQYPTYPLESVDDEPEIPAAQHVYLAHWMTWEAASLWDEAQDGVYDPELAKRELALFERRFGPARSANELRVWNELPRQTAIKPRYFA